MSSLWTPGGEHPIDRGGGRRGADPSSASARGAPGPAGPESAGAAGEPDPDADDAEDEALRREVAEAQQRVLESPVEAVIANHAVGLFQLAGLHLGQRPPNLQAAQLAIDAMAALVEGLTGRLGEEESTLRDALAQLRLAFVQIRSDAGEGGPAAGEEA